MQTIKRVETLIASGHESSFIELADKLESKVVLHAELQEKLDALGNTPIAEPELYKAGQVDKITLAKELLTTKEISEKYTASEVGDFIHAVGQHISALKLEDGTFKSTPNTEECDLPNFFEADELVKIGAKEQSLRVDLKQATLDNSPKKIKKISDEIVKTIKKTEERAFEISGLDVEKLTDWEKILVIAQVYASAINASLSSVGKRH